MYGKKRGNRRTGSQIWGSAGEAAFSLFFLCVGILFLVRLLNSLVIPEWNANQGFVQDRGTVKMTRVGQQPGGSGVRPEILIRYEVDGQPYEAWTYDIHHQNAVPDYSSDPAAVQEVLRQFVVDQEYAIWRDPADPKVVVLVRGYSWWLWLLLLLPTAFILIGGIGLVYTIFHWGKSVEHREATAQLSRRFSAGVSVGARSGYPTVPQDANLTNSPGTRLKYRLPIDISRGWRLLAIVLACLFWNGIVAVFIISAVSSHRSDHPDWWLTLFVLPFAAVGIGLIYYLVREIRIVSGVGPTHVEISDHPLRPGQSYQVLVSQSGRVTLEQFEVSLVCEEMATYQQGTDTRTDRRVVYRQSLIHFEKVDVIPGASFEQQAGLVVPMECMHSFTSEHNEIQWKIVVHVDLSGWPPFDRSFPVVVCPEHQRVGSFANSAHQYQD